METLVMSHEAPSTSTPPKNPQENAHCSFCGKPSRLTGPMVEGPQVYICVNCILVAAKIAEDYCKQARESLEKK
jgi:ClpX C4-type zinc finger protein